VLVRYGGSTALERALGTQLELEDVGVTEDDAELWQAQRDAQRSDGAVVKVSGRPTDLPDVITAAGDATVVSRAALGLSWLAFAPGDDLAERVDRARSALAHRNTTVLDGASKVENPWPDAGGAQVVMERLKARFDPARIFRPGSFVGGI
jgi:glycolate oxidase FAD binding subunit